jgi:response regulator RpfG family c-di-GMP phosphodiesterase
LLVLMRVHDYITKPIKPKLLVSKVKHYWETKEKNKTSTM